MSNLLPDIAERGPWVRMRGRLLMVTAFGIGSAAVVAAIALVPALIAYEVGSALPASRAASDSVDSGTVQAIQEAQILLSELTMLAPTSSPAAIAADIIGLRPKDVSVEHVTYARNVPGVIVVSGKTSRRDAVNEYRAALASDPRFAAVSVPINALVGTQDGSFSLTVTGSF